MPNAVPTRKQLEVLRAIHGYHSAKGWMPSIRELCVLVGVKSTNGVVEHLTKMQARGLIDRDPQTARGMTILPLGQSWIDAHGSAA